MDSYSTKAGDIAEETWLASAHLTGAAAISSRVADWKSLHLRFVEWRPSVEHFEYLPTPDPVIVLVSGHGGQIECTQGSVWRKTEYRDGSGCVIAGNRSGRVRWNLPSGRPLKLAYAYIPQSTVERVAAELSEAGITHRDTIADIPYFERPAVSSTIKALFSSMKEGASEFFAQTAAQWLALQFLVSTSSSVETSLNSQTLTDARIERVLEYMEAKLSEPLSLDALAREAGVSKFHFIGLFRRALGTTPHKHLLTLRRELAASMLLEGSRSVLDIGLACGFQSPSHFAAIFKQAYGESPSSYRVRRLTPQFSNQIN